MEEKEVFEITKNIVANFIDDEDKFVKQQTIDHIIKNGKYYDVINISRARVKQIVKNGLKYEQLEQENEELKKDLQDAIDLIDENNNAFNKTFEDIKNNAVAFYEAKDKEFLELQKELEIYKNALNNAVETLRLMDGCEYDCNYYLDKERGIKDE